MKENFLKFFDLVFDEDGNVRACGRGTCAVLIQAASNLEPHRDSNYFGVCDPASPRFGFMNVQHIKELRETLT